MKTKENYLPSYDLLRIVACLTVIFHHYMNAVYVQVTNTDIQRILLIADNILMVNNGIFFMMSGKFALERCEQNLKKYYINKVTKVIIPMVLISLYYFLRAYDGKSFFAAAVSFYKGVMANQYLDYLWFVYSLIGFYLIAPFLAVMMKSLNEKEKLVLTAIIVGFITCENIFEIAGIVFVTGEYPFYNYISYCLLGYLVDHTEFFRKHARILNVAYVAGFAVSTFEIAFYPGWNPSQYGFCLSRVLMCMGVYVWIARYGKHWSQKYKSVLLFISAHSYYVYLLHGLAQETVFSFLTEKSFQGIHIIITVLGGGMLIFALALAGAVIFKKIYDDMIVKKLINRKA